MIRLLPLAVLLGLALPTAASAAAPTVIGFEGLGAPGTVIDNQYAGDDITGVQFGDAAQFTLPQPPQGCVGSTFVAAGGIAGDSADISCNVGTPEFPERRFGTAFEFFSERRMVSFKLSLRISDIPVDAVVRVYAIGGALLEERTVSLTRNTVVPVAFSRPATSGGISGITISGPPVGTSRDGTVLLDDIVASLDDVPPPPKFSLALPTPSLEVVEGATASAPVAIRRFNGSTGPVTVSVGALPSGIRAAQVVPNPLTGRNNGALVVSADSPLSGERQLAVSAAGGASAGTGIGTSLVQTFRGVPALQISEGGLPIRLVAGCGPQTANDGFSVRGNYRGAVAPSARAISPGLTASASTGLVDTTGDGSYPVKLTLDPGANAGSGGEFSLELRTSDATFVSATRRTVVDRVSVARIEPGTVARPLVGGGSTVAVVGNFPPQCAVSFVDGTGLNLLPRSRNKVEVDGRLLDRIVLELLPGTVSGPLRVLAPSGAELARTSRLDVTDFRNLFALSGANAGPGAGAPDYTWGDFERTFGTDDTDACFVFCVRDPIAAQHYNRYRASVQAYGGLCVGWTIMALRFRGFAGSAQRPGDYLPAARRAYEIGPLTDGTAVKRDIVRWQVAQSDKPHSEHRSSQANLPAADERRQILDLIREAGGAMLAIYQGTAGHAVVAYAARQTPSGTLTLAVYDPNVPYAPGEETTLATRTANLAQSTITIDAAGNWSGSSLGWLGNNASLRVLNFLPREDASLPSTFSLASLLGSSGGPPPAGISSVRVGAGEALAPDGTGRPGSGVVVEPELTGVSPQPQYQLDPGREYAFSIRGTRAGRYEHGLLGRGSAATVSGAATTPGQEDRLTVRPGEAQLGFTTGAARAPVTYDLAENRGKATRTAAVRITARKGAGDEAELGGGVLRLEHDGAPTTATVTLGSVGEGLPGSVTTAPLKIGRGESLELRPRSWTQLADGVRLTVRSASGRVRRRSTVRLVTTKAVAVSGVGAKRRGTKVTLTGRITKRGSAPVLAATAELVRGGRVVRRRSVTRRGAEVKAGRFSVTVPVGGARRGTTVRVTITLLDEAAGLATIRRRVTVRG